MFRHILVAVDGSPQSSKTIQIGIDLAKRYAAIVTVMHAREYERYEGADIDLGPPITAQALVDQVVSMFREAGVEATGVIRRVRPSETPEQIIEVAKSSGAELIVMGTRGMSEFKSILLGGVANKVVHHATCPVLLVR
ncbi:MAG: universal stress protein [Actinomycetota bacterium]